MWSTGAQNCRTGLEEHKNSACRTQALASDCSAALGCRAWLREGGGSLQSVAAPAPFCLQGSSTVVVGTGCSMTEELLNSVPVHTREIFAVTRHEVGC